MHVSRLTTLEELTPIRAQWQRLSAGIPFRSCPWLESWWCVYGPSAWNHRDRSLLVLAVRDTSGELTGLAPWFVERTRSGANTIRFLGTSEVCSDYLSVLSKPQCEQQVATALADWLSRDDVTDAAPPAWDLIDLPALHEADRVMPLLAAELEKHGATVHRREGVRCWRLVLPSDWEAYLAQLSKSHRKQIRRLERRYFASGTARLFNVRTPDDLDRGLAVLEELHQRRRASLGQKGCFASAQFRRFIRHAAEQSLAEGMLRLSCLEIHGRPAAAEFQLRGQQVMFAYQAGLDPDMLEHEPGRLITLATIKQAIDEGCQAIDLLRGDEPYKAHWRATPLASYDMRIVANRGSAQLRHRAWLAGVQAKKLLRSSLKASGI